MRENRKAKRIINLLQSLLCFAIGALAYYYLEEPWKWPSVAAAGLFGLLFFIFSFRKGKVRKSKDAEQIGIPRGAVSELILLNEENTEMTRWSLYNKTGLVIGRDIGENQVNINLDQATYAGMIEVEHASLNYSANHWYLEDLFSKNGVSIQKSDGKKYKIAPGKPCKLEKGDIIYIAMTKLLLC